MARAAQLLVVVSLLMIGASCDRRDKPGANPSATDAPDELAERLLGSAATRRQWPAYSVKMWLAKPTVAVTLRAPGGRSVRFDAWSAGENDYNTPMMRIDGGDMLLAITRGEFEELKSRAGSP